MSFIAKSAAKLANFQRLSQLWALAKVRGREKRSPDLNRRRTKRGRESKLAERVRNSQ